MQINQRSCHELAFPALIYEKRKILPSFWSSLPAHGGG
jgi:hypothetical protein